jgi:hypothetical protein
MAERAAAIGAWLQIGRARASLSGTRVEVALRPSRMFMRSAPASAASVQKAHGVYE